MKNILSSFACLKTVVLVAGLACALPAMAHAEGFKGKFTLTAETHWGTAVLPPGDYDFALDPASVPTKVIVRAANGKIAVLLVSMWSSEASALKTNSLQLETHGGEVFVSALYLTDVDIEIHFAVPKMKEGVMARETAKVPPATMTASVQ